MGLTTNKKANVYSSIMLMIMLFIVGMIVVNFFMPRVDSARTDLVCSSAATISDGTKMLCLIVDFAIPYFIILVFSIVGGVLFDKVLTI